MSYLSSRPPVTGIERAWSTEQRKAFGRRVRAAMVLANVSTAELVERIGTQLAIGRTTLHRITQGERPPRPLEIEPLARELGVPAWFLTDGFLGSSETVAAEALEHTLDVDDLGYRLKQIETELRRLAGLVESSGDAPRAPRARDRPAPA